MPPTLMWQQVFKFLFSTSSLGITVVQCSFMLTVTFSCMIQMTKMQPASKGKLEPQDLFLQYM